MTNSASTTIDGDQVAALIDQDAHVTIVEALPVAYYDDVHIPGAMNLPHDSDDNTIASVLPDRERTVIVYCSNLACPNSSILSRRLVGLGFTDVREYEAGKQDWMEAGRPTASNVAG